MDSTDSIPLSSRARSRIIKLPPHRGTSSLEGCNHIESEIENTIGTTFPLKSRSSLKKPSDPPRIKSRIKISTPSSIRCLTEVEKDRPKSVYVFDQPKFIFNLQKKKTSSPQQSLNINLNKNQSKKTSLIKPELKITLNTKSTTMDASARKDIPSLSRIGTNHTGKLSFGFGANTGLTEKEDRHSRISLSVERSNSPQKWLVIREDDSQLNRKTSRSPPSSVDSGEAVKRNNQKTYKSPAPPSNRRLAGTSTDISPEFRTNNVKFLNYVENYEKILTKKRDEKKKERRATALERVLDNPDAYKTIKYKDYLKSKKAAFKSPEQKALKLRSILKKKKKPPTVIVEKITKVPLKSFATHTAPKESNGKRVRFSTRNTVLLYSRYAY